MHDCEASSSALVLACSSKFDKLQIVVRFTISFLLFYSPVDLLHLGGFGLGLAFRFGAG